MRRRGDAAMLTVHQALRTLAISDVMKQIARSQESESGIQKKNNQNRGPLNL